MEQYHVRALVPVRIEDGCSKLALTYWEGGQSAVGTTHPVKVSGGPMVQQVACLVSFMILK